MQSEGETKEAIAKAARDVASATGMTAALADTFIEKIYVYPGKQLEIVWKMKEFWGDYDVQE